MRPDLHKPPSSPEPTRDSRRLRRHGKGLLSALLVALALLATPLRSVGQDPPVVRDELSREAAFDIQTAKQRGLERNGEVLPFRWKIGGFLGALAGLFVPNSGDALLTIADTSERKTEIELLITAPNRDGEYFLYGSEIDRETSATSSVWSSQTFRGRRKDKEQEVHDPTVVSYATAILRLRWDPPTTPVQITVWNDGKVYPAVVEPIPPHVRKISGRKIEVRGYGIQGAKVDGKSSFDEKLYLFFALDETATPVEILGRRSILKIRVQLADGETLAQLAID